MTLELMQMDAWEPHADIPQKAKNHKSNTTIPNSCSQQYTYIYAKPTHFPAQLHMAFASQHIALCIYVIKTC